jgi:hypothetical protein
MAFRSFFPSGIATAPTAPAAAAATVAFRKDRREIMTCAS